MSQFKVTFRALIEAYGRTNLFRLITYDAGAGSTNNASLVVASGYDFLFALKVKPTYFYKQNVRRFERRRIETADASTEDVHSPRDSTRRYLFLQPAEAGPGFVETIVSVLSVHVIQGEAPKVEQRFFYSSLEASALTGEQWLRVVRNHWGVENNCHHTWDTAFQEDDHPWVRKEPFAMMVLMMLRRIAYNVLALHRIASREHPARRPTSWRELLHSMSVMMLMLSEELIEGLRVRPRLPVTN